MRALSYTSVCLYAAVASLTNVAVVSFSVRSFGGREARRTWSHNTRLSLQSPSASDSSRSSLFASLETDMLNPEAVGIKKELMELAERTDRGFQASNADKKRASQLVLDLARYNPTTEPAFPYYSQKEQSERLPLVLPSLSGKWTLVYTDAPDITGLDTSKNPFSTAKLGRIGQECDPPLIKNVIEWLRPDWAVNLPFSGSTGARVLQKVVTSGSATAKNPLQVDLKVVGIELVGKKHDSKSKEEEEDTLKSDDIASLVQSQGLPAGLLMANPVDLKGPLSGVVPFGRFEVLYLDEDMRIIKTSQNYLAINRRLQPNEEWF